MYPVIPLIKKILEHRTAGTVVDIGCGQGHHSLFLAEKGFTVTAIDIDKTAIKSLSKIAKEKNLSIDARVGDIRAIDTLKGRWDIVICTFVLHFLQNEDVEKVIRTLKTITDLGGLNVIGVHTIENVTERQLKPHLFEADELRERYTDWQILYYWHGLGKPFISKRTGETLEKYRADLIAQKS